MLRSAKEILGYTIRATDDDLGRVHDFYFDDWTWTIRYLVVDTGKWLPDRQVLIAPEATGDPDWGQRVLPVQLTRELVEGAPSIDLARPVSREYEAKLADYYGWMPYWGPAAGVPPRMEQLERAQPSEPEEGTHLRSVREVTGYQIHAADEDVGHVEDFITDTDGWFIRYVVVDTRNWLPGRKVLVSPAWVTRVNWADKKLWVGLTRDAIEHSPEFDPGAPVNREYEARLYDYYGRPKYWE
ncbi:MAG: PRC-barrel domain-containing protein [Planctomycetota bacterium]